MKKAFLVLLFLSLTLIFPKSEALAVGCLAAGYSLYTTDPKGKIAGPVKDQEFTINVTSSKPGGIKPNSTYDVVLSTTTKSWQTFSIEAKEDNKITSPGWRIDPGITTGNYYFTLYEKGGRGELCRGNSFVVLPTSTDPTIVDICKDNEKCSTAKGVSCSAVSGTVGKYQSPGAGIMTALGCIPTEPRVLVESLLWYGSLAAGGIAFLLMILAALQMITSEGNPQSVKEAQEKFYSAIIGLLFIIFAVLILQVIGVDILGLQGFTR